MSFIHKIKSSELFKITSLNSVSVLVKIGIGLITSKFLAVFIGPKGMALVGNLRNFLTSVESISTLGFQNGIVKYVAENESDNEELKKFFSTLFFSLIAMTLVLSSVLFFFANYWNSIVFDHGFDYSFVFKALAIALPWYAASIFLLAIMNGLGQFRKVIYINIIGTVLGFIVTLFLIWKCLTLGALLAIIITPSLLFFVSMYFITKEISIISLIKLNSFDFKIIKNLSHYFLMAVVSGILGPLVFLVIRNQVIDTIGLKEAGFWEAISRISTYYLLFVNTLITLYYYPKLVVAKNNKETKKVFFGFYKSILPLFGIGLIVIYCIRVFIVQLLFTNDF
ncbi:MAG: O-antigen translocase, partial [Flavobacterium sp.]